MSLEEELRQEINRRLIAEQDLLEVSVTGGHKDVPLEDMVPILLEKINAIESAIYRIAGEIDKSRA